MRPLRLCFSSLQAISNYHLRSTMPPPPLPFLPTFFYRRCSEGHRLRAHAPPLIPPPRPCSPLPTVIASIVCIKSPPSHTTASPPGVGTGGVRAPVRACEGVCGTLWAPPYPFGFCWYSLHCTITPVLCANAAERGSRCFLPFCTDFRTFTTHAHVYRLYRASTPFTLRQPMPPAHIFSGNSLLFNEHHPMQRSLACPYLMSCEIV